MSERNFKIGDRVQTVGWLNGKQVISTGEVLDTVTETRPKNRYPSYGRAPELEHYVTSAKVKWDDGREETISAYQIRFEDNEFEKEFRKVYLETSDEINEKLKLASKYLDEAVKLSEERGVPFSTGISFLGQSYKPASFSEKWSNVDEETMREITETYNEYDGWEHSAVC